MDKNTIGSFLAALRKAGGMTQKELAEKLNVSDKAVSRWERDESAPDLTLIPVIAEIFGVTSDELLRGQRQSTPPREGTLQKPEKQLKRILDSSLNKFRSQICAAVGLAFLGMLGAVYGYAEFSRALLGFLIAAAFTVVASICLAVFTKNAFAAVKTDSFDAGELNTYKAAIFKGMIKTVCVLLCTATLATPLFLFQNYGMLTSENLMAFAVTGLATGVVISLILYAAAQKAARYAGLFALNSQTQKKRRKNGRLLFIICFVTVFAFLFTFICQYLIAASGEMGFARYGTRFDNFEDFKSYMDSQNGDINEVIEASDGTVLCQYYLNPMVTSRIDVGDPKNGFLPVTVYTSEALEKSGNLAEILVAALIPLYAVEAAFALTVYFKKRIKY